MSDCILNKAEVRRAWKRETAMAGTKWNRLPNNMLTLLDKMVRFQLRTYAHKKPKKNQKANSQAVHGRR